jgi:hypothetical protein
MGHFKSSEYLILNENLGFKVFREEKIKLGEKVCGIENEKWLQI